MKKIEIYNYNLIRDDLKNIYVVLMDILKEDYMPILVLGWFQYFILVCIEILNYSNANKKLKNKKALENCRARIKPLEIEYDKIHEKMEKLNLEKMNEYKNKVNENFRESLESLIYNYGVYKIDDKIMGNTFLYESLYKKIIYENNQVSKEKIISASKEIAETIIELIEFHDIKMTYKGKCRNIKIKLEDYNVFCSENSLFANNIETNDGLILLNSISLINFYNYVISKMNVRKELKYRLAYIIYDSTYENILKVIKEKDNIEILKHLDKYELLKNRDYRNCMFHYNLSKNLEDDEIKDEMYFGIISKYLGINEEEYVKLIDKYMYEISGILEKSILQ